MVVKRGCVREIMKKCGGGSIRHKPPPSSSAHSATGSSSGRVAMYESSCSYQVGALELKRASAAVVGVGGNVHSNGNGGALVPIGVGGGSGAVGLGSAASCPLGIKSEEFASDWPAYRFCNPSTFEQLKQSVEKAKAALQDRSGFLGAGSAFSDLYNGVAGSGRTADVIQDTSNRLRGADIADIDIKRTSQAAAFCYGRQYMLPSMLPRDYWLHTINLFRRLSPKYNLLSLMVV